MSVARRFIKNFFWLSLGEVIFRVVGFIVIIIIARHFSPAIYGQWSWASVFTVTLAILPEFGFSTLTVREVARHKEKTAQFIDNAIFIKIALSLITFGLIAVIIQFLGKDSQEIKLVYFLGIFNILNTFATFFQAIFRAYDKMHYETIARFLQSMALLALTILFITNQGSILTVSYAYIIGAIIGLNFSLIFIWRYFNHFHLKINWNICKELIKQAWPFALSAIAIIIYYNIGIVLLGLFKSDEEVGYYNAAFNIITTLTTGLSLLLMAIFPTLSNLFKHSLEKFKIMTQDFIKFIYLFSLPGIIFLFFNAQLIIQIIYGNKFIYSSDYILQILLWAILIMSNYAIFGIGLSASDQQKKYLRGVIIGAVFNIIVNLLLIPKFGMFGCAYATIFTELAVCSYMSYQFIVSQKIKLPVVFIIKTSISGAFMLGAVTLMNKLNINLFIASVLGLILFAASLLMLKTFKNNPLLFLRTILTSK